MFLKWTTNCNACRRLGKRSRSVYTLAVILRSWRLTMGMSWQTSSCTTRSTPSSTHTNRPLPNPAAQQERGDTSALSRVQQRPSRTAKGTATVPGTYWHEAKWSWSEKWFHLLPFVFENKCIFSKCNFTDGCSSTHTDVFMWADVSAPVLSLQ